MTTQSSIAIIQRGASEIGAFPFTYDDTVPLSFGTAKFGTTSSGISPAVAKQYWNNGQAFMLLTNATWLASAGCDVQNWIGFTPPLTASSLPGISPLYVPVSPLPPPPPPPTNPAYSVEKSGTLDTEDLTITLTGTNIPAGYTCELWIDGNWIFRTSVPNTWTQNLDFVPGNHEFTYVFYNGQYPTGTSVYYKKETFTKSGTVPPPPPPPAPEPTLFYAIVEIPTMFQGIAKLIPASAIVSGINTLAVIRQSTGWRAMDAAYNQSTGNIEIQMEKSGSIPVMAILGIVRAALWILGIIGAVITLWDITKTIRNAQTQSTYQADTSLASQLAADGTITPEERDVILALLDAHKGDQDNGGIFGEAKDLIMLGLGAMILLELFKKR